MPTLVSPGEVIAGKYRVEKVLGVGGMGMVVSAIHLELEQRVAIKFLLPDAIRVPTAVDRFLREAKAVVKLRSEHVCRVFDVGRLDDGAPYTVMEYLEGVDFADLLATRTMLPPGEAVDLMMQAIEGVAEAHANHIVHRDLKPANLFVSTDGDGSALVKVLDFGISKSLVAGSATKTGDVMGSPSYMAPEQLMSTKNVDARADVWALGVILYQAVTGQLPFEAEALPALCMSVIHDTPRAPIELEPRLPRALSDVIMRCLAKSPTDRFNDVASLATVLATFGSSEARTGAARVEKMLRRASGAVHAFPTEQPTPVPVVPTAALSIVRAEPDATTQKGQSPLLPAQTTLSTSTGQLSEVQPRRTRSPLLLALLGGVVVAMIAIVAIVAVRRGGKDTSVDHTKRAVLASAAGSAEAPPPEPTPVRRKPKLQVTQLSEQADAPKPPPTNKPIAFTRAPDRAEAASGSGSAAIGSAAAGTAAGAAQPVPAGRSLASLFLGTGVIGTWLASRLGDGFLAANFGPMATLQIASNPSGASVTYENAVIGVTPLSIKVERGAYAITVDLSLAEHVDRSVDVSAMFDGTTTVNLPMPVALKLLSKPAGAEVQFGGETVGKTPLEIKVPPDESQSFTLKLEGYEDKVVELSVPKAATETVVLERKLQQIVHEIDSVPTGADVLLDGAVVGKTPMKTEFLEVRGGTRHYVLRMPGDQQRFLETQLRVPADKPLRRVVKMRDSCAERAPEVDTGRPTLVNPYDPCRVR